MHTPPNAPVVFIESSSDDGASWEVVASGEVSETDQPAGIVVPYDPASMPTLRVRWEMPTEPLDYWWLRVWTDSPTLAYA